MQASFSTVHPTEIRTSISPSLAVELNMTSALANYATEAGHNLEVHEIVEEARQRWYGHGKREDAEENFGNESCGEKTAGEAKKEMGETDIRKFSSDRRRMEEGFSFLWGPINHLKHLFSRERLPFTAAYFGSLVATLYFALSVQSTPLTVLFAVAQVMALLWFLISYIPGGQTGLAFFTRLCSSAVTSTVSKTITSHAKQLVDRLRLISHVRQSLIF
uniref:Vesicle transport protein n=1 Tax=Timema genevievae TaxID=629358 RepID=A0A7R9PK97_TIMGE|nr:unnamed protein product [Timema genevievae]